MKYFFGFVFLMVMFGMFSYLTLIPFLAIKFGIPTQATVAHLWQTHGRGSGNFVRVEYSGSDKQETGDIRISYASYGQLVTGMKVNIHYLPLFPERPALDADPNFASAFFFLAICGFLVGYAMFFYFRQRDLLIRGKVVVGHVLVSENRAINICYFVQDKEYLTVIGKNNKYGSLYEAGKTAVVLYDPDKPERNEIYDPSNCIWIPDKELF